MRCPRFHRQVVPAVHEELCSRKLLVMEEIHPSIPLHTALDRQAEQIAKKRGITKELFIAQEQVCNPLLRLCTVPFALLHLAVLGVWHHDVRY